MRPIWILAAKDLRLLCRDPWSLFWSVVFPLLMACLFGFMIRGQSELKSQSKTMEIVVVDQDNSDLSRRLVARLEQSPLLKTVSGQLQAARENTRKGRLAGYVVIPEGLELQAGLFGNETVTFELGMDPARRQDANALKGILMNALAEILLEQMKDPAEMERMAGGMKFGLRFTGGELDPAQRAILEQFMIHLEDFSKHIDPKVYRSGLGNRMADVEWYGPGADPSKAVSPFEAAFPLAMVWGLIGCAASFALTLVQERTAQTDLRLRFAPLATWQWLAGKSLACYLTCLLSLCLLLLIGMVFFGVRIQNVAGLLMALGFTGWAFVGIMMTLGMLGRTEHAVAGAGWSTMIVFAMFGGAMVPLRYMPAWMNDLSLASPVRWAVIALEGALWRGYTASELLLPLTVLAAFGIVGFVLGWILLRVRFE